MGLLHRNPEARYGASDIKKHPFFMIMMEMDWEALEQKDLPPPIRPVFPSGNDTINFPERFTKERVDSFVAQEPKLAPEVAAAFWYDQDPGGTADDHAGGGGVKPARGGEAPVHSA